MEEEKIVEVEGINEIEVEATNGDQFKLYPLSRTF